jgi:hypothetical protein
VIRVDVRRAMEMHTLRKTLGLDLLVAGPLICTGLGQNVCRVSSGTIYSGRTDLFAFCAHKHTLGVWHVGSNRGWPVVFGLIGVISHSSVQATYWARVA